MSPLRRGHGRLQTALALLSLVLALAPASQATAQGQQASAFPSLHVQATSAKYVVGIPANKSGILLGVRGTARLTVRVTDGHGKVVAGKEVDFTAPESGPGGSFVGGSGTRRYLFRTRTDAAGNANARFSAAGRAGDSIVEARLAGTAAEVDFGVSVGVAGKPRVTAVKARTKVSTLIHGGGRLYGPVLLPAGGAFAEDAPLSPGDSLTFTSVTALSWFFWIDDAPAALFSHPVRFVLVSAGTGARTVIDAQWWPRVRVRGSAGSAPLFAWDAPIPSSNAPARLPVISSFPALDKIPVENTCYINIYGPGPSNGGLAHDANLYDAVLHDFKFNRISDAINHSKPTTKDDITKWVQSAAGNPNCKKLIITISAHGEKHNVKNNGGFYVGETNSSADSTGELLTYDEFGKLLQPLQKAGITVYIYSGSCFSGEGVTDLSGYGVSGEIASSSGPDNPGHFTKDQSQIAFGAAVRLSWQMLGANAGPTDILAAIRKNITGIVVQDMPQAGTIKAESNGNISLSPLELDPGQSATVAITRPPGAPVDRVFVATVQVTDPSVATPSSSTVVLAPGQMQATVVLKAGTSVGSSSYSVEGHIGGVYYIGAHALDVGSSLIVDPSAIELNVGDQATVTVQLKGVAAYRQVSQPGTETTVSVSSSDGSVAAVGPSANVNIPNGSTLATFSVQGAQVGISTITVSNPQIGTAQVQVTVVAKTALVPSPAPVNFGTVEVEKEATQLVTFTNSGSEPLTVTGVSPSSAAAITFSGTGCSGTQPVTIGPKQSCTVKVSFNPEAAGEYSTSLTVNYTFTDSKGQQGAGTATVQISGTAKLHPYPMFNSGITAIFNQLCFCTTYGIDVSDNDSDGSDGNKLTYEWTNSNKCGTWTPADKQAVWLHPDSNMPGACPFENIHPATITVVVSDEYWDCTATYTGGSGTGSGPKPDTAKDCKPLD